MKRIIIVLSFMFAATHTISAMEEKKQQASQTEEQRIIPASTALSFLYFFIHEQQAKGLSGFRFFAALKHSDKKIEDPASRVLFQAMGLVDADGRIYDEVRKAFNEGEEKWNQLKTEINPLIIALKSYN